MGKERRGVESKYKMKTPGPGAYNLRSGLDDVPAYKLGSGSDLYGSYGQTPFVGDDDSYQNEMNEIILEEDAINY